MKSFLLVLVLMVAVVVSPLQADELQHSTPSTKSEARHLPQNYLLTFTLERLNKEPFVISMLVGGREAKIALIEPSISISATTTVKDKDSFLLDYQIGTRVKTGNEQWLDEGIKGAVYLSLGKEATIFREPGRALKLKISPPLQ